MKTYPVNNISFNAQFRIYQKPGLIVANDMIISEIERDFAQKTKHIPGELSLARYEGLYENPRLSYSTSEHFDFLDVKLGHFYNKENFLDDLEKVLNVFVKRKSIIVKMLKTKSPAERQKLIREISVIKKELPPISAINIAYDSFNSRILQLERFLKE